MDDIMRNSGRLVGELLPALLIVAGCSSGSSAPSAPPPPPPPSSSIAIVDAFPSLNFSSPLFLTSAPGDSQRIFVETQGGVIYVFNNSSGTSSAKVFLDLSAKVDFSGEMGLLGLTFDPDYASNGYFYVNYNPVGGALSTSISRFKVSADPDSADANSETVLLSYAQPFGNHKGGWLGFGADGKLYVAVGDGGGEGDPDGNAQNLDSLLGKILRINSDGSVPGDNPFYGQSGKRGEIWAYGLRNPFRDSFDPATGKLWAADAGQDQWEEIDTVNRGGNYGWRKFEGDHVYNTSDPDPGNTIFPLYEYGHDAGRCVIIGGYVYRGSAVASLIGKYLFADYCTGELWSLPADTNGTAAASLLGAVPGNPTSFGEDAAGEIYVTSFDGHIYKLVPGTG